LVAEELVKQSLEKRYEGQLATYFVSKKANYELARSLYLSWKKQWRFTNFERSLDLARSCLDNGLVQDRNFTLVIERVFKDQAD